ncbi:MAG TPA: sensor histidine kinase [Chloroflexi bacterium]|nr:sensor histidine kinase [Chloroflexota bacterium]
MTNTTSTESTQLSPFEQLLENSRREYQQVQTELKEIDLLIKQTAAEVERLVQRNAQATTRLRQIEAAFDTVPREDIREAYTAVREVQQRLFTMRGQLEKLQSDQKNLSRYAQFLRQVLEVAQHPVDLPEASREGLTETEAIPPIVRVIEAQERERQRLARRIHDGPAQSLTNLILQAEICERLFEIDPEKARTELANLKNAVVKTFKEVKEFISTLRPMMLDDLGLIPTLRRYVEDFKERHNVEITLNITGRERRLANYKEVTVFRVIQELMGNAVDISQATAIQVGVDIDDQRVQVVVEDNGRGFEPAELTEGPLVEQMGLDTIRERVEMLQGRFHIDSQPGKGTRATFEIPLP